MYALFDIGGSKTRIAVTKDQKQFSDPVIFDTHPDFESGIALVVSKIQELADGEKLKGVAGGITGTLNEEKTELTRSPNLSGWTGHPLEETLRKELDCPVFMENDAAIVGLGEALSGAGAGDDIVVYITVSTGVGGARIVSGGIDEHAYGFEPGSEIIDLEHSLESLISGSAVEERFGKKPYDIPQNNPLWDELAEKLAFGLHNTIVHWSPDSIILGGSMIVGDPAILVSDIQKHLQRISQVYPQLPKLKKATLGAVGGLYGAMHYVNSRLG